MIRKNESGFSLLEVTVAVGIMALGFLIMVPNFTNSLNFAYDNEVKNELSQAVVIIENQKFFDGSQYPLNPPDSFLVNEKYNKFTYNLSQNRINYCLTGESKSGLRFTYSSGKDEIVESTEGLPSECLVMTTAYQYTE
jgi:type II secretory pathway pseudopilin PulG